MLRELEMGARKSDTYETLVKGYGRAPPTLKVRAITKIAIELCQKRELKQHIIFELEMQRLPDGRIHTVNRFNRLIIQRLEYICEKIPLPLELKNRLIARFQSVALQLFSWKMLQDKFNLSPVFAGSLLIPSDWTAEGRLDEKKIAVRLVRDERISAFQRYKMACFHCIEFAIYSLWNQVSTREDLFHGRELTLVKIWSKRMAGEERFLNMEYFWGILFLKAVKEGSMSTTFHSWYQGGICSRTNLALTAVTRMFAEYKSKFVFSSQLSQPGPYRDILYFLLTRAPKDLALSLLNTLLQDPSYNVLVWFAQWSYLDTLIPIIKELWDILPVEKYGDLLLTLAHKYSDEADYGIRTIGYVDYDYGDLIVKLLEESPDRFKRYLFSDNRHTGIIPHPWQPNVFLPNHQIDTTDTNPVKILYIVIGKKTLNYRNIRIFQRIWHYVALGERRSFFKSEYGELFCCFLARKEKLELLESLLKECLPEDEVVTFQNKIWKRILNEDALVFNDKSLTLKRKYSL